MFYGIFSRPAVHFDTEKDIPDLTGKAIAITGGKLISNSFIPKPQCC